MGSQQAAYPQPFPHPYPQQQQQQQQQPPVVRVAVAAGPAGRLAQPATMPGRPSKAPSKGPAPAPGPVPVPRFKKYNPQTGLFSLDPKDIRSSKHETYAVRREMRERAAAAERAEIQERHERAVREREARDDQEARDGEVWRRWYGGVGGHGGSSSDEDPVRARLQYLARAPVQMPMQMAAQNRGPPHRDAAPPQYQPQYQQPPGVVGMPGLAAGGTALEMHLQQQLNLLKWKQMKEMQRLQLQHQLDSQNQQQLRDSQARQREEAASQGQGQGQQGQGQGQAEVVAS